jgi:molecular chaperone GrpE
MVGKRKSGWAENEQESPEIRVTDRRRIYLDDDPRSLEPAKTEQPNLKPSYVEELEARTKAAENKVLEVQSRFDQLRSQLQKETDETRQRLNRAADERAEREKATFIGSLLPVLDNLLRAVEASDNSDSTDQIVTGVRQTAGDFEKALRAVGVEPIVSVGEVFNPELHEAVETVAVHPEMDGRVVAEYARGYRIGDRLLRPARVKVGTAARKSEQVGQ